MATQGTPLLGLQTITEYVYQPGRFSLVCYTNAQDSLGPNTTFLDLVQPTQQNGYAPILLDGTFTHQNGVVTYEHLNASSRDPVLGSPAWFPTGPWSAPVTGVAMIANVTNRVVHFMDIRNPVSGEPSTWIAAAGKRFTVDISELASN